MKEVRFESVEALALALIKRRRFCIPGESKEIHYDEDATGSPFRFGNSALAYGWNHYEKLHEIVEWYEEALPGRVLCWTSDRSPGDKDEAHWVTLYIPKRTFPFRAENSFWKYATPVKPEECLGGAE